MRPLSRLLAVFGMAAALQAPAATPTWTIQDLDTLTAQIASGMSQSASYGATQYPWQFLDCTADSKNCFGTNPDSPYGAPNFAPSTGDGSLSTTLLNPGDALVIVMETPPEMRYFGLSSYLFSRYYPVNMPTAPGLTPGSVPVFESLNDTVNHRVIATAGATAPGGAPFGQLSLLVLSADGATEASLKGVLTGLGVPATAVNWVHLPLREVPLHMGTASTSDSYSLLLRMAYPTKQADLDSYRSRAPLRVLLLTPPSSHVFRPAASPSYRTPGSAPSEDASLADARDALLNQALANFQAAYSPTESPVQLRQTQNYVCIAKALACNGDNSDAIYSQDVSGFRPQSLQDRLLIVGINHVSQGKATYLSHSLVAAKNNMGVLGVSDSWLAGTGLRMAGISDPADPRYAAYSQLYAFTMSYDCQGDPLCVVIPRPVGSTPGIAVGAAIDVTGRIYLDPQTLTRPSTTDIQPHRVVVLRHR
jgi:hypothetical protein